MTTRRTWYAGAWRSRVSAARCRRWTPNSSPRPSRRPTCTREGCCSDPSAHPSPDEQGARSSTGRWYGSSSAAGRARDGRPPIPAGVARKGRPGRSSTPGAVMPWNSRRSPTRVARTPEAPSGGRLSGGQRPLNALCDNESRPSTRRRLGQLWLLRGRLPPANSVEAGPVRAATRAWSPALSRRRARTRRRQCGSSRRRIRVWHGCRGAAAHTGHVTW